MNKQTRVAGFSGVMLADRFDPAVHQVRGWMMSEKLDGVRALWNGECLVSRGAIRIPAPSWFTDGLPRGVVLDGELWMGRGQFQRCSGVVRRVHDQAGWDQVRYMVFDAPGQAGGLMARVESVGRMINGVAEVVAQTRCRGAEHLDAEMARVLGAGGEGLIIRDPHAGWEAGRSSKMLKVKASDETDARVLGYQDGCGAFEGLVGALLCATSGGIELGVGTGLSVADRRHPPEIGSVIRVGHCGLTDAGVPRFPTFLGVRAEQCVGAA